MMKSKIRAIILALVLGLSFSGTSAQTPISLVTVATGLQDPVDIASAGDGSGRLFFVEQRGEIKIFDGSSVLATPFLDIKNQVQCCVERGLLGLVFHPDYANNGFFYVNYTNTDGDTRISRFTVSATDPDVADPGSEIILLQISQPFPEHNAGDLNFGLDGYLYIATGDGGSAGDPGNRAQNPQELLGKMLRIDVDSGLPYAIPEDNPFVNDPGTLDEIWALGLRNPWRFSFDRLTGDMWIADVGQNSREEVNYQSVASPGGENYGWRCYEGNIPFDTTGCGPSQDYTFPVFDYVNNGTDCSVTGGFVYRGSQYPDLYGHYLFIDFCSGNLWTLVFGGPQGWTTQLVDSFGFGYTSFGEDEAGEIYLTNAIGTISRIASTCTLNQTLSMNAGTLNIDYDLGALDPVTWNIWLSYQEEMFKLVSVPIPASDPPFTTTLPLAGFPPLGTVGILTTLTSQDGILCSDWGTVDTN